MNQEQYDNQHHPIMSRHQMIHRGHNTYLAVIAVILGIACAAMIFVTLWAFQSKSTMAAKLADAKTDYNKSQTNVTKLKEAYDKLSKRRKKKATKTANGNTPVTSATYNANTSNSHGTEYYIQRCKKLETELSYATSMVTKCMELMTPEKRKELQSLSAISITDLDIENEKRYIRVRFTVTNNTSTFAQEIGGYIRFWNGAKMVAEYPFEIDTLEAKDLKRMSLKVPTVVYTKYDAYIKMN